MRVDSQSAGVAAQADKLGRLICIISGRALQTVNGSELVPPGFNLRTGWHIPQEGGLRLNRRAWLPALVLSITACEPHSFGHPAATELSSLSWQFLPQHSAYN